MSMQIKQSRPFVGFSEQTTTANLPKYCKLAVFNFDSGGTFSLNHICCRLFYKFTKLLKIFIIYCKKLKKIRKNCIFFLKNFVVS